MSESRQFGDASLQRALAQAAAELRAAAPDRSLSVLLYGSAVRGGYVPGRSDVNLLVVLASIDLPLLVRMRRALRLASRRHRLAAVFWTEADVRGALDVFPLEFAEILAHHRVLLGDNPLAGRTIDDRNLRHQIEYELRTRLLRLRDVGAALRERPREFAAALGQIGASAATLLECARARYGGAALAGAAGSAEACRRLKYGATMDRADLETLFQEFHEQLTQAVTAVDAL